jgi:hypothetical protein
MYSSGKNEVEALPQKFIHRASVGLQREKGQVEIPPRQVPASTEDIFLLLLSLSGAR